MSIRIDSKKQNIAILGFGKEGRSIFNFIKKRELKLSGKTINVNDIWILDSKQNLKTPKNIKKKLGNNYLKNLKNFDIIFRSPGIPYNLTEIQEAKGSGVKISSATNLFFEQIRRSSRITSRKTRKLILKTPVIIGITGSKGKGTTCSLLFRILKNSGFKTLLAGNIGKPMLDILPQAKKADFVILELSSFQLQDLRQSPDIAIILDIFPEHLDIHKNLKEYYESKANIGRYQKKNDLIFYFKNSPLSKKIALKSPAKKFPVAFEKNNLRKNYEIAASVARYLGCSKKTIKKTIKNCKGLEHRLELTRAIRVNKRFNPHKSAIIKWVNDSAATNPEATAAAIKTLQASNKKQEINSRKQKIRKTNSLSHISFSMPLILIAGGKDKNLNYSPLKEAAQNSKNLKAIILFGENKNKIKKQIANRKLQITFAKNLDSAIKLAYKIAKKLLVASGYTLNPVIVFSPASTSFDMFKNYEERGKKFKKIVKSLR